MDKRSGAREPLRAAKLARSIARALTTAGTGDALLAYELAATALAAATMRAVPVIASQELATVVERLLRRTGYGAAAHAYAACGLRSTRRRVGRGATVRVFDLSRGRSSAAEL